MVLVVSAVALLGTLAVPTVQMNATARLAGRAVRAAAAFSNRASDNLAQLAHDFVDR
jgi:hypothetical protein